MSDMWADLAAWLRETRTRARREAVDHIAPGEREAVTANVRGLYKLRQAVDDAIDAEVARGRELGVQWDLLGPTRQQAQQRHKRATARRAGTGEITHEDA